MTLLGAGTATAAAGASTPLTIFAGAGGIWWYDAQDASTLTDDGGGAISQWRDKGAGADHLNATTTARPTFSGSGSTSLLTFDGTTDDLETATDGVSISTTDLLAAFVVGQYNTGGASYDRFISYLGTGQGNDYANTGSCCLLCLGVGAPPTQVGSYRNGNKAFKTATVDTDYRMASIFDGTNHEIYTNNTAGGTPVGSTGNFATVGTWRIGAGGDAPPVNTFLACKIKEIVIVAGLTITSGMRSSMETYFTGRW